MVMDRERIETIRNDGEVIMTTDLIYSPDDGGFYLSQFNMTKQQSRSSVKIFRTAEDAKKAYIANVLRWERWS